jgi:hypothetical protein
MDEPLQIGRAELGHNAPPLDDPSLISLDLLRTRLAEQTSELRARLGELQAGLDAVGEIADDDVARRTTDFLAQCDAALELWEAVRVRERRPVLDIGQTVQDHFLPPATEVKTRYVKVRSRLAVYDKRRRDALPPAAETAAPIRGDYGSAAVPRTEYDITVVDFSQVPRAYLKLDYEAVRLAARAGINIPGLQIVTRHEVSVRHR